METCQKNSGNGEEVMTEDKPVFRINTFRANKIMFEQEIEEFLSYCPNMTGEDDLREFCHNRCAAYYWCQSIEPAEVADDD